MIRGDLAATQRDPGRGQKYEGRPSAAEVTFYGPAAGRMFWLMQNRLSGS